MEKKKEKDIDDFILFSKFEITLFLISLILIFILIFIYILNYKLVVGCNTLNTIIYQLGCYTTRTCIFNAGYH